MLSPDQRDFAARLLRKAGEDLAAVQALLDNESISDDVIGFHAQQAVEKAMKSVLVVHGVAFRRAHDLSYLLQVAGNGNVDVPEHVAATRWLTPWAAEFRYDEHEMPGSLAPRACKAPSARSGGRKRSLTPPRSG